MIIFALILFLYLSGMVAFAQYKGDTSIANFTWGGGTMLVALYSFVMASNFLPRQILVTSLIVFWCLRLATYVYVRYTGRDPRFVGWKWRGITGLLINIGWIFGQIIMIGIMGYPALFVNTSYMPEQTYLDLLGTVVWIVGFVFESISDYQLFVFMKNPANKGHVMQSGLWHYSRHPNYFGEVLMWWGIFIIALSLPYGWTTIIAPVTITILLLFVTGIPWIEKTMENNPEYQEYKKRTSAFIPWFVQE